MNPEKKHPSRSEPHPAMSGSATSFQPAEVLVVEASAGAGKTYTLAKRYLNLLINPGLKPDEIPLKSILAITFTNKAMVEMKERILEFLKRLAFDEFPDDDKRRADLYQTFGISQKKIQQKAVKIMEHIIRNYDLFQVQTIDSFINTLLTGCALHIDRTAGFRIKDNADKHIAYSLDCLIEESVRNKQIYKILTKFIEQYIFTSNNAGWFPKNAILDEIRELYRTSNIYGALFNEGTEDYTDVIKLKREIYKKLAELAAAMPDGQKIYITNRIKKITEEYQEHFQLADLPPFYKHPEPPMNKDYTAPAEYKKKWTKIVPLVKRLAELETRTKYPVYINLFRLILEQFSRITGKEDIIFLEELNCKATGLTRGEKVTLAELYYRLATRFRHYLLDEFQDTNELQWCNLKAMVDDALASGGSLFYVGDRKQAIFRFRGGEPQLFSDVANGFKHYNVRYELLLKNRRSEKEIVDFNNWVFSADNLKRFINHVCEKKEVADMELFESHIMDIYRTAKQEHLKEKNRGYVRVEHLVEADRDTLEETIKERLIATVLQLSKRFQYREIAVLVRDNKQVELITNWLMEQKIPVESERTLNVLKNRKIMEIISLLKFLESPIDELSFGGFILGEIFSKAANIPQQKIRDYLFELKTAREDLIKGTLYTEFRSAYPEIWKEYLEQFFGSAGFISPYELIVSIYQRFRVMENFPENQVFFIKFLDFVKSAEDEYGDLAELLAYLQEQSEKKETQVYVSVPQSNSIKIQTVHKSKGLEFPVVILPFLEPDIRRENRFVEKGETELALLHIKNDHTRYCPKARKVYYNELLNNIIDELNNIYVALTRAKSELYVFISGSQNKDGEYSNPAFYLIPKNETAYIEKGKQVSYPKSVKPEHSEIKPIALSQYRDWLKSLREETNDAGLLRNRNKIIEGNVMHFLLTRLPPDCTEANIPELIKKAIEAAGTNFPFLKSFTGYQNKLNRILRHPDLKAFFYVKGASAYCEKEFVNKYGDSRRIDRLIITDKEVVIVDYKSALGVTGGAAADDRREEYQKQIREYAEIARAVYPGRRIKAYIIFLDALTLYPIQDIA